MIVGLTYLLQARDDHAACPNENNTPVTTQPSTQRCLRKRQRTGSNDDPARNGSPSTHGSRANDKPRPLCRSLFHSLQQKRSFPFFPTLISDRITYISKSN